MNEVYRYCGYSKQAFHQKMDRLLKEKGHQILLLPIIEELRLEHPGVAARQLYEILKPDGIGRDKFERMCFENGYKLSQKRSFKRTTNSTGVIRFPNLLMGRELNHINQAWVSDITYYQVGSRFYYLTFVMDLYSRFIVGYSVAKQLSTTQTTLPALKQALKQRKPSTGVIFHSDGGGQYYCKEFLKLTARYKMKNSMSEVVYENPHAERVNGTIKNQYLKGYSPQSLLQLIVSTKRAIKNYNTVKPHKSLKKKSPADYESNMPAGGGSLDNDDFCNGINTDQLNVKSYHSPLSLTDIKTSQKRVGKTVNVF
jgi:putative transposase